jgi:hypothetical protein
MWEWTRTVAERAASATWQSWQTREPEPTVTDPDPWTEDEEAEPVVEGTADYWLIG